VYDFIYYSKASSEEEIDPENSLYYFQYLPSAKAEGMTRRAKKKRFY
jgi:hypothetical protein